MFACVQVCVCVCVRVYVSMYYVIACIWYVGICKWNIIIISMYVKKRVELAQRGIAL